MGPFPEQLETHSLILRKPVMEDAKVIHAGYGTDPEVARYVLFRADQTLLEIQGFLQRSLEAWERGASATWMITTRPGGELIGSIDLRLEAEANLGYVIARKEWGKGFATEAVRTVSAWALGQADVHRVWAAVEVHNAPSIRVLEKAGFVREELMERWLVFPNLGEAPRDCYKYVLERSAT